MVVQVAQVSFLPHCGASTRSFPAYYIITMNAHAHILPRAGPSPEPYQSTHACMHTHTRGTPRTHACMCTHTRVTFRPESKSDLGSCETILRDRLKRSLSHAPSARVRLAYTVYARARTRLSACACADDRTYVRTYIHISRE